MNQDYTLNSKDTITNSTPKMNRLILRDIPEEKKKALLTGSVGIAGVLTGVGMFKLFGHNVNSTNSSIVSGLTENDNVSAPAELDSTAALDDNLESIVVETSHPFSSLPTDDSSFSEAFKVAREDLGAGGFFEWRGNTYNTYYKDEWTDLSDIQQDDFIAQINDSVIENSIQLVDDRSLLASNSNGINIDGDAENEIILEDVNSDGIMDVKSIDLNNDGHIDVIHVSNNQSTTTSSNSEVVNEASIEYRETENSVELDIHIKSDKDSPLVESLEESFGAIDKTIPIVEPLDTIEPNIGLVDLDENGIVDARVIDNNLDGYADVVKIDINEDNYVDIEGHNLDDDQDLDVIIIDEGQDGIDVTDRVEEIDEIIRMDEFMFIEEDNPIEQSSSNVQEENTELDLDIETEFEEI